MSSILTIAGTPVDRPADRVVINRVTLSLDQPDTLEFTEKCAALPGQFGAGDLVTDTVDGTARFSGQIVGSYPQGIGRSCIDIGYRALGLAWLANQIWVTGSDGGGVIVYNRPQSDPDYIPVNSGLTVGNIIDRLLALHTPQLAAAGIVSFNPAELALLTVVPPETVVVTGRLWNAIQELTYTWCNKWLIWIDPDGVIHCESALTLPATTITLDAEPAILDQIYRDHSECYTRVVCRGADLIEGAYLSLADLTLTKGWTPTEEANWTLQDFYAPKGAADLGAITGQTSTTVTVQSDDPTAAWSVNYLSGIVAEIWCYDPLATSIAFIEQRRITSNTALTPGGTSVITVDSPFNSTGYTRYSIRGQYAAQSLVWRKYEIAPTFVAQHLVNHFSHSFPWSATDGIVTQTFSPQASVCFSSGCIKPYIEVPATFDIVPPDGVHDGYIVFHQPVVKAFGTISNLSIAGATDGIPCDLKVLVPYSRGAVSATAPTSGFEGTAYTVDGVERTLYKDFPQWTDYRDTTSYQTLAQETLDTVKNTVVEGCITYFDKYVTFLAIGQALNIAGDGYTTGYEAINATVRTVTLDYCSDGGAVPFKTRIQFSTRLRPFAGDRLYAHPAYGSASQLSRDQDKVFWGLNTAAAMMSAQQGQIQYGAPESGNMVDQTNYGLGAVDVNRFKPQKNTGRDPSAVDPTAEAAQATNMRRYLKNKEEERARMKASEGIDFHLGDLGGMKSAPDKPTTTDE